MNDSTSPAALPNATPLPSAGTAHEDFLPGTAAHTAFLLQNLVLDSPDVEGFLDNLTYAASEHVAAPDQNVLCGVTLLRPRHNATIASSSPEARRLDELQYAYGDGPCLTAARTQQITHVDDTTSDTRWPDYFTEVAHHGVRSILGVPIPLDGDAQCGLNFYSTTPDAFTQDVIRAAGLFAREASQSLRLSVRIASLTDKAGHLNRALDSRTTIDLAAGIIMGQNKCSQTAAMSILKAASSHRQLKLRALAAQIVATINDETPITHFDWEQ